MQDWFQQCSRICLSMGDTAEKNTMVDAIVKTFIKSIILAKKSNNNFFITPADAMDFFIHH